MKIRKRFVSAGIGMFCSVIATVGLVEENRLTCTEYTIYSEKITEPITITQLSDLHLKEFGKDNSDLVSMITATEPDLILCTGDMINYNNRNYSIVISLLKNLQTIAPVYYSFGNHEFSQFLFKDSKIESILMQTGAGVLNNQIAECDIKGNHLVICGLSQGSDTFVPRGEKIISEFEKQEGFRILLAHRPELFLNVLSDANADASFAGHAHGGQIRIFDKGIYSPDQGWFPKLTSGMHKLGSNTLMISRGLGDHTMMPRINNAPELVVCHIKGEKS